MSAAFFLMKIDLFNQIEKQLIIQSSSYILQDILFMPLPSRSQLQRIFIRFGQGIYNFGA